MPTDVQPLLRVENLAKRYSARRPLDPRTDFIALNGVSFSLAEKNTLALVGESGSGKSTLALCLACLETPSSGAIWFDEKEITALDEKHRRLIRPQIQLVFQDPATSLNPRWSAFDIVSEPLIVQNRTNRQGREEKGLHLLDSVGIPRKMAGKKATEFSGGQKQRLAIARALALEPKLLILDESLSALDCSVQAQICNLLLDLQASFGLTYLFITHDLAMAAHLAHEIAVMHRGQIVDFGARINILRSPNHEATRSLLAAMPRFAEFSPRLVEA